MARNLDEFARDLNKVTQEVVRAAAKGANDRGNARALYETAKQGESAVRRVAEGMSTADLKAAKKILGG